MRYSEAKRGMRVRVKPNYPASPRGIAYRTFTPEDASLRGKIGVIETRWGKEFVTVYLDGMMNPNEFRPSELERIAP